MGRAVDGVGLGEIALVQFDHQPTPHVVRIVAPFSDGASAELWAIEHGYRHYALAPLVRIGGPAT